MRQRDLENNNELSQSQETKIYLAIRECINGTEEENIFSIPIFLTLILNPLFLNATDASLYNGDRGIEGKQDL
jgi:hypothetical protein